MIQRTRSSHFAKCFAATLGMSMLFGAVAGGCSGDEENAAIRRATQVPDGGSSDSEAPGTGGYPFEPISPASYTSKVKNLLVGLPVTDAEVQAVVADPAALRGLIDGWMELPQFKEKMVGFFRNAFQQNNASLNFLTASVNLDIDTVSADFRARIDRAMKDSFALTAWELVKEGRPLTEAVTTNRQMLNPPLMSLMSYIDETTVDDAGKGAGGIRLAKEKPIDHYSWDLGPTTLSSTLNPSDPNYMLWHGPHTKPCTDGPIKFGVGGRADDYHDDTGYQFYLTLRKLIYGEGMGTYPHERLPCYSATNGAEIGTQFSDEDWSNWRMVTIRPTTASAPTTAPYFWNILEMRSLSEMRLRVPRVGFMGTLAFQANWTTNAGNSARVTANQALIVAIGRSITSDGTPPASLNTNDANHAANPECAGCHARLDPFRQFFRQSYTLSYSAQEDKTQIGLPASFNIAGVTATGQGVQDVANILANHPRFALAWVLKLHYWANTLPALETDPEVLRVAEVFRASNFDFKVLVRELFSSPLVTWSGPTETTVTGGVRLSIARRDHYCAALSNRLGLTDVCAMNQAYPTADQAAVAAPANLLPADTFVRAAELPSLPTDPDLFFRASVERMCTLLAGQVVDVAKGTSLYVGTKPDEAIDEFVKTVMALPSTDPRAEPARALLKDNFTQSTAAGASASDALKSTFTLACISPSAVIVGL